MIIQKRIATILLVGICVISTLLLTSVISGCSSSTPTTAPPASTSAATSTPPATTTSGQVFNLRFSTQWPEQSPNYKFDFKPMLDEIEQQSNGRIKFTIYAGGVLGAPDQQYDIVRTGKADMGTQSGLSYIPGRFPLSDIFTLPFAFSTTNACQDLVQSIASKYLAKETSDTKILNYFQSEMFYLYTANKQVKTMEDIKGLKIRSAGGIVTPALTALGATPVQMGVPDLYTSLQTGVVDGAITGPSGLLSFKTQEVLKYATKVPFGMVLQVVNFNPDSWAKLPPDLQKVISDAAAKYPPGYGEVTMLNNDDPVVDAALIKNGGAVYTLPADEQARWAAAVKPVVSDWASGLAAKGLPIEDLMTAVRDACQKNNIPFPY